MSGQLFPAKPELRSSGWSGSEQPIPETDEERIADGWRTSGRPA